MAECIIANTLKDHEISVLEANSSRLEYLSKTFPTISCFDYKQLFEEPYLSTFKSSEAFVLAVKPQNVPQVFSTFREYKLLELLRDQPCEKAENSVLYYSICAGISLKALQEGFESNKVVRVMPNTPAMIGEGLSVWFASEESAKNLEDMELTRRLLGKIGTEIRVSEEEHIDMATAISGTGPAYVFLLLEAMIESAVHRMVFVYTFQGACEFTLSVFL